MTEIGFEKLIEYAKRYDDTFEWYPESEYEGESVMEEILDYAREDQIISLDEHGYLMKLLKS